MKHRRDKGRIEGPFVPWLVETGASAGWRAMSSYARVVYMALKSRYSIKARNNGRIYLSARDGAEETGFDMKTVARALRELKHYGFIVMTEPGCLGVDGRGKAPHWRLTEIGYMTDLPTKDFLKWDGELFHEQKSPRHYTNRKQKPVPSDGTECTAERYIPVYPQTEQFAGDPYRQTEHTDDGPCTVQRHISRLTTPHLEKRSGDQSREGQVRVGVLLPIPDDLSIPPFLLRT
jgi:hypothetical protein